MIAVIVSLGIALYLSYSIKTTVIYFIVLLGICWMIGMFKTDAEAFIPEIQLIPKTEPQLLSVLQEPDLPVENATKDTDLPAIDFSTDTSDPLSLAAFYARNYGLMPQLVQAVMIQETGGTLDPTLVSPKGAAGLMQLMPGTAERYGLTKDERFIPEKAIEAGVKYLKFLDDKFNGNTNLVLAAYNAGEGRVMKYKGIPPFKETQNYVKRIIATIGGIYFHGGNCHDESCLSVKEGARAGGQSSPELFKLASEVQNRVNIIWFPAFNDKFPHKGKGHREGRAFDVTLVYLKQLEKSIATIKEIGQELGLNLVIIDEYTYPSEGSTGGHLHVEIKKEKKERE